jgi:hypothetical protein
MAIDIEWQDECGHTIERYDGPPLESKLLSRFPASSVCLSAIKPWDDATFNQTQVPTLLAELDAILLPGSDSSPPATFAAIRQFVAEPPKQSGIYLKFLGD